MYTNIQSLVNKKSELLNLLEKKDIHLLFLTETWITNKHSPSEYYLEGYQKPILHFKSIGGSAIYIKNGINFLEVNMPDKTEDSVWISIKTLNNRNRLYGTVYRSPNSSIENNKKLLANLRWARDRYKEILVVGDFNLPSISWETFEASGTFAREFLEVTEETNLEQLVTEATRYRHGQNPSLLDLILSDESDTIENIQHLPPIGKSDHVNIVFQLKNAFITKPATYRLNHRRIAVESFSDFLRRPDWFEIFDVKRTLPEAATKMLDTISEGIKNCTPVVRCKDPPKAPWMNSTTRRLSDKKRRAWDLCFVFINTKQTVQLKTIRCTKKI